MMVRCEHCGQKVWPSPDRTCPSCRRKVTDKSEPVIAHVAEERLEPVGVDPPSVAPPQLATDVPREAVLEVGVTPLGNCRTLRVPIYQPSWRAGIRSAISLPLATLASALVLCVFTFLAVGILAVSIAIFPVVVKFVGYLVVIVAFVFAIVNIPPQLVGMANKYGKNRNPLYAFLAAFFSIWIAWISGVFIGRGGSLAYEGGEDFFWYTNYGPVLHIAVFAVLSVVSGKIAWKNVRKDYFCEECDQFMDLQQDSLWPQPCESGFRESVRVRDGKLLVRLIKEHRPVSFDDSIPKSVGTVVTCQLHVFQCTKCHTAIAELYRFEKTMTKNRGEEDLSSSKETIGSMWLNPKDASELSSTNAAV